MFILDFIGEVVHSTMYADMASFYVYWLMQILPHTNESYEYVS